MTLFDTQRALARARSQRNMLLTLHRRTCSAWIADAVTRIICQGRIDITGKQMARVERLLRWWYARLRDRSNPHIRLLGDTE